jgi:transposase
MDDARCDRLVVSGRGKDVLMSVQPRPWPEVPEQTAAVARAAFPKGTLAMRVRDELPGLFTDEQFASAFGVRGKPGISPGQLALVTVLQFVENLTDRQAADAVRGRIDWKYALSLELTDPGFDHTVLTGFRQRLIDHGLEEKVLDLLLARLAELGMVKAGGRQRTDSTHVLAAVRAVNRLEFLTETLRAALEALSAAAPDWLAIHTDAQWVQRYGARADSYRLPQSQDKRTTMAVQVGADGFDLLDAIHADHAPAWLREVPAVVVLRRVWITQYHRTITDGRQEVAWREDKDLSPSRQQLCSPYDTDARYATKRGSGWEGYKVHLSETCDDATTTGLPHLITNVATTDATVTDVEILEHLHTGLGRHNLLPDEHIVDAGYTSAELMVSTRRDFNIRLPVRLRLRPPRWAAELGFSLTDLILAKLTQGPAVMIGRPPPPAAPKSGHRSDRPCHSKVAGQTHCLRKLERATTTVDVPKTLLKCQSSRDQGSLGDLAVSVSRTRCTALGNGGDVECTAWCGGTVTVARACLIGSRGSDLGTDLAE